MMKIAIIGAGNMGAALARGLVADGTSQVTVSNPSTAKLEALEKEFPSISVTTDNRKAVVGADIVVLAVKPYIVPSIIEEIKSDLNLRHQAIVSLAATVSLDQLADMLELKPYIEQHLFIAIPNTAIAVREGITFICTTHDNDSFLPRVKEIFETVGEASVISERLLPAAMALCSCGIAYAYKYVQACVQAAVELGLRPAEALDYTVQTVAGAMKMLSTNHTLPQQEIDRVTTPGGLTIKGINELERTGFTASVISAVTTPVKK